MPGDSRMVRWGLTLGTGPLSPAYRDGRAYHFKSRFRRVSRTAISALPRMTCGAAMAFIRLASPLEFHPLRLLGLVSRWQKRIARATLTSPDVCE